MAFGNDRPPAQQAQPAMRVEPEINKAVLDEQERRRRVQMNRELSRISIPSLQKPVGQVGFSKTL
jgi:hypothetical protein